MPLPTNKELLLKIAAQKDEIVTLQESNAHLRALLAQKCDYCLSLEAERAILKGTAESSIELVRYREARETG